MKKPRQYQSTRRRALRSLASAPALAAAAVAGNAGASTELPTPETPVKSKGYQETQHVRDYYRTADI